MERHDDDGCDHGDVDQQVLDDGDHRRRAQSGRIGEGGQDDEGDDQRQVAAEAAGLDAHCADHDLDADKLQRDVWHGREDAGERDRQREPSVAEPPAHEVGRGDVAVLVRDRPEARKHE